jgi:hypothetical protein
MTTGLGVAGPRCATHPARLAADACPRCARGRCAADVTRFGAAGCAVCAVTDPVRSAGRSEVVLRAALAAIAVAFPTGWVAAQYVNVEYMSLLWPVVTGLAVSAAASGAAGRRDRSAQPGVLAAAIVGALLGTALGFRIFDTPVTPVQPWDVVWGPYAAAIGGVFIWPLVFGGPKPVSEDAQDDAGTTWKT